jgi:solute carrier family 25 phosphate transporter 3
MAPTDFKQYDLMHYVKGGFAGGLCCGITHGALCPVDVVKTRIQLQPEVYNRGMIGGFRQVIAAEGMAGLATGLGPTVVGYFIQGWFKFGGVEFFKIQATKALGEKKAFQNQIPIYLGAAACAEFIADIFLCPLEATRIRLVSDPTLGKGLFDAAPKILKQDGFVKGFYSGFTPILLKQIPYTMAKFAVQGWAANKILAATGKKVTDLGSSGKMALALSSGVTAGVAAAIISHPADTLLSLVNKSDTAGGSGSVMTRVGRLAKEAGLKKLCLQGLGPRCVMIGSLTAGQFAIYDTVMQVTGAKKFHFHNPDDDAH